METKVVRECEGVREGAPGDPKGLPVSGYTHLHPPVLSPAYSKNQEEVIVFP